MKIRHKALFIIAVSVLFLLIGLYLVSKLFFFDSILNQERESARIDMERALYLFKENSSSLETLVGDWAPWNDTLEFVNNPSIEYINDNLSPATISNLKIEAAVFLNEQRQIVYSIGHDPDSKRNRPISDSLLQYVRSHLDLLFSFDDQYSIKSGIISLPEGFMLIAFAPITDSEYEAPISGTLVFGRYLDKSLLVNIEEVLLTKAELLPADPHVLKQLEPSIGTNDLLKTLQGGNFSLIPANSGQAHIYFIIETLDTQSNHIIKLTKARTLYKKGIATFHFFLTEYLILIILITIFCLYMLQRFVVAPVTELCSTIEKIDLNSTHFSRLIIKSNDEIGLLADEINNMLNRIEQDNDRIIRNERQLKQVFQASKATYFDMNMLDGTIYLSPNLYTLLGYEPVEGYVSFGYWKQLLHKEDYPNVTEQFRNATTHYPELQNCEFRLRNQAGSYQWFLIRSSIVEYEQNGKPKRVTGIIIDIDDKKKIEEDLKYLSFHDKLTGIYNRGYFEYVLNCQVTKEDLPLSIIIGDLNGLKVINDAFGHTEGDNLLIAIANVLVKSCREQDIVCRWGGDEFALILKNAGEDMAEAVCEKVKNELDRISDQFISLNISLGHSTKHRMDQETASVIQEAEERMYRNKLFDDSSVRNSILSSLKRALYEKSYETEEHTGRMYDKCKKIGSRLNLSNAKIDELALLAVLHDIGKVAITDSILNKSGPLTKEEWEIMKTHSEIGFRIANSSPEISHISYPILCHHERYDGKGYPRGIKGNEIPTISRIVTIVDAYDVMTHDRPYKQRMTVEEAIKELKACSGSQFDPELLGVCIEVFEEDL